MDNIILFLGNNVRVACDEKCNKAWGINNRPKNYLVGEEIDPDDYEYLTDDELGDAPITSPTREGGYGKPETPAQWNKWCVRECERCQMCSNIDKFPELKDFSKRIKNKPNV